MESGQSPKTTGADFKPKIDDEKHGNLSLMGNLQSPKRIKLTVENCKRYDWKKNSSVSIFCHVAFVGNKLYTSLCDSREERARLPVGIFVLSE